MQGRWNIEAKSGGERGKSALLLLSTDVIFSHSQARAPSILGNS